VERDSSLFILCFVNQVYGLIDLLDTGVACGYAEYLSLVKFFFREQHPTRFTWETRNGMAP
jgi:uncharacterized membrane-anchored protein